jgi:hypothetical protein
MNFWLCLTFNVWIYIFLTGSVNGLFFISPLDGLTWWVSVYNLKLILETIKNEYLSDTALTSIKIIDSGKILNCWQIELANEYGSQFSSTWLEL